MKECKKWLEKFDKSHQGDRRYEPMAKQGWKAALLWFYKVAEHLSPSDYDLIDKELEDETKKT